MIRVTSTAVLFSILGTSLIAADFSSYRGWQFGMDVGTAAKQAGMRAIVIHQKRPTIQQINWEPLPSFLSDTVDSDSAKADPFKGALLCFLAGQLFRIEVTYDRYKIQGMTADDMVDALSLTYGAATRPNAEIAYHSDYAEVAPVLARWQDSEYSYDLVRTGGRSGFAMVLYSKRLDALAQAAIIEAVRLEAQEAPQRELEKEKKAAEEERLALEKARSVNKANFRP